MTRVLGVIQALRHVALFVGVVMVLGWMVGCGWTPEKVDYCNRICEPVGGVAFYGSVNGDRYCIDGSKVVLP